MLCPQGFNPGMKQDWPGATTGVHPSPYHEQVQFPPPPNVPQGFENNHRSKRQIPSKYRNRMNNSAMHKSTSLHDIAHGIDVSIQLVCRATYLDLNNLYFQHQME